MKIFTWTITIILSVIVFALGMIYILPGWDIYIVRSGSMEPLFSPREIIVTGPVPQQLTVGEVITFQKGKERITHRIFSIKGDSIVTRGDANDDLDPQPVSRSQITGVYLFSLPGIGYLTSLVRTRTGWFLCVILPSALLVIWIVVEIIREAFRQSPPKTTITAKSGFFTFGNNRNGSNAESLSLKPFLERSGHKNPLIVNRKTNFKTASNEVEDAQIMKKEVVESLQKQIKALLKDLY